MTRHMRILTCFLAVVALIVGSTAPQAWAAAEKLTISKIYWEYNASANDLGVHVSLDGPNWRELRIVNPKGRTIFEVEGSGPYNALGMTELFFEGAEPNLADVALADLLAMFPEGKYRFSGQTVDGNAIVGTGKFTHAIPDGPKNVSAVLGADDSLVISWSAVTNPPPGFPPKSITIVGYQVIVGAFQVTVPATTLSVTVSPEFVASLPSGENPFEVLAIEKGGNQTLREGTFIKP